MIAQDAVATRPFEFEFVSESLPTQFTLVYLPLGLLAPFIKLIVVKIPVRPSPSVSDCHKTSGSHIPQRVCQMEDIIIEISSSEEEDDTLSKPAAK